MQNIPRLRLEVRRALQQADYSFYQRLRPDQVNEQYLWDQRLLPLLGYLSADQAVKVREALSLAYDAHSGQQRKSGEPFITHPVEVTRILAELKMDYECLVAGLLHDTVEDCSDVVGLDEIEFHFGRNVRRIVEGETKFCKLPSYLSSQAGGSSDSEGSGSGILRGLPLPRHAAAKRGGAAPAAANGAYPAAEGSNDAAAGAAGSSVREVSWGANGAGASSSNGASGSSSGGESSSDSSGSVEFLDPLEAEAFLLNGSYHPAADSRQSLDGPEESDELRPDASLEAGDGEEGANEEASPPPMPSTFTQSEGGRQPLLDLVLSTPGNDKPSRAQDIQFLFLAMTEEWRIIVVKLADRLHNMRTMGSMPPAKARKIAAETLEVFGPLARLLGLYSIKEELEELAFKYAYPQAYDSMRREVKRLWDAQSPVVEAARQQLEQRLEQDPYLRERVQGVRVTAARKALYSSWKKLLDSRKGAKDVRDLAQLLVVAEPAARGGALSLDYCSDKQLCYHVMGLVHSFWAPIPGTMKDYIATPKPNNYQSLHTTVVPTGIQVLAGANGKKPATMFPIEVQIRQVPVAGNPLNDPEHAAVEAGNMFQRTEAMNRVAELGIAVDTWAPPASGEGGGAGSASSRQPQGPANGSSSNGAGPPPLAQAGPSDGGQQPQRSWVESLWQWAQAYGSDDEGTEPPPPLRQQERQQQQQLESQQSSPGGSGAQYGVSRSGSSGSMNGSGPPMTEQQQQRRRQGAAGATGALQRLDPATMTRRINWLNSIRQWQEEFVGTLTAHEFIQCVTDDILGQGVFVFTPGGQIIRLPKGATVVDFAYHIHTQVGNAMAAAKVNSKVVAPDYELQNADVVEVVPYGGPVNASILRKHQEWYGVARTKTARHKIARFLRENSALAASKGINIATPGESGGAASAAQQQAQVSQTMWLVVQCDDRQGILAEVAQIIAENQFNIKSYSGSSDYSSDDASGVLNFALEGEDAHLAAMCRRLDTTAGIRRRAVGCELPAAAAAPLVRHI
ncbi:hypothetical protein N2152v2_003436 [Parachlorella kessleri]